MLRHSTGDKVRWVGPQPRIFLSALALLLPALSYSQATMPDYEVKAAFLYHFTQFIEWPLPDGNSPFSICVANDSPTSTALEHLTRGKSIGTHPMRVRRINGANETQPCLMLFVGAAARPQQHQYLQTVYSSSVLTVGEDSAFLDLGGMIELFLEDQRIAFRLNLPALQRARLNASSGLLRLARQSESHPKAEGYH